MTNFNDVEADREGQVFYLGTTQTVPESVLLCATCNHDSIMHVHGSTELHRTAFYGKCCAGGCICEAFIPRSFDDAA